MKQKPVQQNKLNIQLRPASIEEAGLFYSQMEEGEDCSLGTVGHLRMDFGHGGQEFWSSWWEHNGDHFNTPEFREDLQQSSQGSKDHAVLLRRTWRCHRG